MLIVAAVFIEMFVAVWNESSLLVASLVGPLIYLVITVISAIICKVCKAILVGKYEPTVSPLWSPFVWRAETYSAVLHDFGVPTFIQALVGTPFLAWLMRFLGAKVGSRSFINTTDWTETDLIKIGSDVAINTNAPLQAHLFEDRVMKVGAITIGERCSVGHYSVILCDSELRDDAHVGPMSLVMKGETIPSNTFWAGSPVQASVDPVRLRERQAALGS
jgi:non-ribosomal peptide synthetase-like protein